MPLAYVQGSAQAFVNSDTLTTSAITTTTGNLFVAIINLYSGGGPSAITSVSDSKGNTWSAAIDQAGDATTRCAIYYTSNANPTGGSGHTLTVVLDSGANLSIQLLEISGQAASSVLDQTAGDSQTTGGTSSCTSGATTQNNEIIIVSGATRGSFGTINYGASCTIDGSAGTDTYLDQDGATHAFGSFGAYRIVSTTGTKAVSRTHESVGSDWTIAMATFKELVAAAGQPTTKRWGGFRHMPSSHRQRGGRVW